MQQSNNDKKPGLSWSTPTSTPPTSTPKTQPTKQEPSIPLLLSKSNTGSSNTTARYAGIFVGGLIVGVVFAWGWSTITHRGGSVSVNNAKDTVAAANGASSSTKTNGTAKVAPKTPTAPAAPNTSVASGVVIDSASPLTITSPQAAGQSVAVEKVEVTKPTWVVVYDNNNGTPGNVLGAQLFFTSGSGTVTLLRSTMAGKSYLVGRSIDNGDHKFQKSGDQMVTDANGNAIVATLTIK